MCEREDGRVCELPNTSVPQFFAGAKAQVGNLWGREMGIKAKIKAELGNAKGWSPAVLLQDFTLIFPVFPSPKGHFQVVIDRLPVQNTGEKNQIIPLECGF